MPLVKRTVEPIFVGRSALDSNVKNELEGVVINSLAGVIKQLSSMSKHAENLFGDLVNEANAIFQRSTSLGQRVQRLYERTSQLDSATKEDVKVEDFSFQHHFKSTRKEEQQILSRATLPLALQEVYWSCAAPPDLNNFTNYRDDGKQGLKFYTDPTYFYSLWVTNQNKILDKKKRKGDKKKRKRKENQPKKQVKQVQKKQYAGVDVEFMESNRSEPAVSEPMPGPAAPQTYTESYAQEHRPSGPAPQPTPAQLSTPGAPPPPPPSFEPPGAPAPPPFPSQPDVPAPPPPPASMGYNPASMSAPAPPALPPGPTMHMQMMAPPQLPAMPGPDVPAPPPPLVSAGPKPPAPPPEPTMPPAGHVAPKPPVQDSRSDFLRAIEMGKNLRKVERSDEVRNQSHGQDVASILKRRIVMEVSDTESESDSDDSDSDWSN